MTYASALNRNELFACYGLREDIPRLLEPDEEVLLVLPGVASDFPDVLIATDRRFLKAKVGGIVRRAVLKREVPAPSITGVSYRYGAFAVMRVHVAGSRDVRMMPNRKDDAARFAAELENLIRTGSVRT